MYYRVVMTIENFEQRCCYCGMIKSHTASIKSFAYVKDGSIDEIKKRAFDRLSVVVDLSRYSYDDPGIEYTIEEFDEDYLAELFELD